MITSWDRNFDPKLYEFLQEDGIGKMPLGLLQHSSKLVKTQIKWKSNLLVAGMPLVCSYLRKFCSDENQDISKAIDKLIVLEGKFIEAGTTTELELPFNSFIFLERTLLNVLHRMSAVATSTREFVQLAKPKGIEILDTRKTTPGLRTMERYAVALAGGKNHRYDFTDSFMIKDNQKIFFGGLQKAWEYYRAKKSFYQAIIVEIHTLEELRLAGELAIQHIMLDNFTVPQIHQAIELKKSSMTYEISGGVNLDNLQDYLIQGVDAISLSTITFWPARVDISWKILA